MAGYLLLVGAVVINSFTSTSEERLFIKYDPPPIELMGRQGLFGAAAMTFLITVLSFIPCPFGSEACVFSPEGDHYLESPTQYFRELGADGMLLGVCLATLCSIMCYNLCRVTVVKHLSALAQALGDATKAILVWGVGLVLTLTVGSTHPNYRW